MAYFSGRAREGDEGPGDLRDPQPSGMISHLRSDEAGRKKPARPDSREKE